MILTLLLIQLLPILANSYTLDSWTNFKIKYNKEYNELTEDYSRRRNFDSTQEEIDKFNSKIGQQTYNQSINELSDWYEEELKLLGGYKLSSGYNRTARSYDSYKQIWPDEINLCQNRRNCPIRNQLKSDSCFAFAAVGILEMLSNFEGKDLSEQSMLDCLRGRPRTIDGALSWVKEEGGIPPEKLYPYRGNTDVCIKRVRSDNVRCGKYLIIQQEYDEQNLKNMINRFGPIAVAMRLEKPFIRYSRGVYVCNENDGDFGYYAVLIVGYGTNRQGIDYWIVKNSFGTSWGEQGFAKVARSEENPCKFSDITGILPNFPSSIL